MNTNDLNTTNMTHKGVSAFQIDVEREFQLFHELKHKSEAMAVAA